MLHPRSCAGQDPAEREYDVFISYAHEDSYRVRKLILNPLLRCRRIEDDERPVIFFDESSEGIRGGEYYLDKLAQALGRSKKILCVYSDTYFEKNMCLWELRQANSLDIDSGGGRLIPVTVDPSAEDRVPAAVRHIQFIPTAGDNWFSDLCSLLDLVEPDSTDVEPLLRFIDQPPERVAVNHTLPPIRVEISGRHIAGDEYEVKLGGDGCELHGTTSAATEKGVVLFDDLSCSSTASTARLVASVEGLDPVLTTAFAIEKPRRPDDEPDIRAEGVPCFFRDGETLAVVGPAGVGVFTASGKRVGGEDTLKELDRPVKQIVRTGSLIGITTWNGSAGIISSSGEHTCWLSLAEEAKSAYAIPGDMALTEWGGYVGMWSGRVYRLELSDTAVKPVLTHPAGVQALEVRRDTLYVAGFDGVLCAYESGVLRASCELEPTIHLLKCCDRSLMAIGDSRSYRIELPVLDAKSEELTIGNVAYVLGETELPVIMDARGRGVRLDPDLSVKTSFRTAPGAIPTSADDQGNICIVQQTGGASNLLTRGGPSEFGSQLVFSNTEGPIAVSPSGSRFALSNGRSVTVVSYDSMKALIDAERPGTKAAQ